MKTHNSLYSYKKLGKKYTFPLEGKLSGFIASLSPREQKFFSILMLVAVVSVIGLLWKVNQEFLVEVPRKGGVLIEGIVGYPSRINPLLSTSEIASDADRDLESLIYSGLLKATPEGGLTTDMAKEYTISEDGLVYTVILKDDLYWHDGEKITADDVVFTVATAQNPLIRSPKRASWDGVSAEKVDDKTIRFTLSQAYSPFLENMTMGILPKHIWEQIDTTQFEYTTFNREPIGSGPYKISSVKRDKKDIPEYYELTPFRQYALGEPHIKKIDLHFYANEEDLLKAFQDGKINSMSAISPETAHAIASDKDIEIYSLPLLRVYGLFFNQNQAAIFTDKSVRLALKEAVDKESIIKEVLGGYATAIHSPIPPGALGYEESAETDTQTSEERIQSAQDILERNGWKKNDEGIYTKKTKEGTSELSFSISTSEVPELKAVSQILKETWERMGARVEVKVFGQGNLRQDVIRPRKYDTLFFGEVIGRDSDPFAFWHSSQRTDPGLNIALYANISVDKLLEDARATTDKEERIKKYLSFKEEILDDVPAIFIYSPDLIYVLPKKVHGIRSGSATTPSERFLNVHEWYIYTDHVWKIFTQ